MTPHAASLAAAAAAALLLLLALRLRGPGDRADLLGPPRRRKRKLSRRDAARLRDLVAAGRQDEALRRIRERGYDDSDARRLVRLISGLQKAAAAGRAAADAPPEPGWTETERRADGLSYGRGHLYNETLRREDARGRRGERGSHGD
ncbi:MAG: hypothetical protein JOZ90_09420 [Alphaproteobacteria bacterium]|nr:hypothetical protein [Alphaproteobacteria bacterium]MBV9371857.1 hypothetical protein [Alphaproteobacteria bacterium]MBV9901304.1 hypothetical protein [Alphaproteobacteria bacterium]